MCPLTDVGRDHFATDLIGLSVTEFDNANAALGVGDSTTAFAKAQTDLQAGPNKLRKGMEAGFPDVPSAANILRFRALFGTSEANFAWEEWALFNALERDRYGNTEPRYIRTMLPVLYRHRGTLRGYGLKVLPREAAVDLKDEPSLQWLWNER